MGFQNKKGGYDFFKYLKEYHNIKMTNNTKGTIFICLSALSFATMGAFTKVASEGFSPYQLIFFRGLISALFIFSISNKKELNFFGKTSQSKKILFYRSLLGTAGAVCYFIAIEKLLLANAVLLNNLSPIWVTIFAFLFLKEKITKKQLIFLTTMFIGAIFIIKPKLDFSIVPALIGFSSAIFAGAAYTLIKHLSTYEKPSNLVLWFSIYSSIFMAPILLFTGFKVPTLKEIIPIIFIGILSSTGQLCLTLAYRSVAASKISIFQYFNILFATIYGVIFWGEIPDIYSIFGGVLIIGSAVISFLVNKRASRIEENSKVV